MDTREVLASSPLFAATEPGALDVLQTLAFPRRLVRGQLLFVEGERADHLFLLVRGRLKLVVRSAQGGELLLTVLGPGEAVGELGVLDGEPRSADAQALDELDLLAVPAEAVRALLRSSAPTALAWAQELGTALRRLTTSTADLVHLDLPRRLAKLLLEQGDDGDLRLSQSEVAALLGVARQSLNRALSGFVRRGWVTVDHSRVLLLDRRALEHFSGS